MSDLRDRLDEIRGGAAYNLLPGENGVGDWAALMSEALVDIIERYVAGTLDLPGDLTPGLVSDPLEQWSRDVSEGSASMKQQLVLPSAYAALGALAGGSIWTYWNGRNATQACPATMQQLGLAASGAGKSTTHRAVSKWFGPALEAGHGAVQAEVSAWSIRAHEASGIVLAAAKDKLTADPDEVTAWKKAKSAVAKAIDQLDLKVAAQGVATVWGDTTAEALVSGAIDNGGSAFIKSAEQDVLDNLVRYSKGGGGASLTLFTDGWDGAEYRRARKNSGVEAVSAFTLSMSLLTQTETFFKSFSVEGGGDAWLDKGLIGRVLLGMAHGSSLEEEMAADLALKLGGTGKEVPVDHLVEMGERVAQSGAGVRAARLVEARMSGVLEGMWSDASPVLKQAVYAAKGLNVVGIPVTLRTVGEPGVLGLSIPVAPDVASRIEDVHGWLARALSHGLKSYGVDRVLTPLLTRLTYHLVRVATIRQIAISASSEEGWEAFLADPELSQAVLEDTAVRVMPWLVEMHLSVVGQMVTRAAVATVRAGMEKSRGQDLSEDKLFAAELARSGVVFPASVSDCIKAMSRGKDDSHRFRLAARDWFEREYRAQVERGEEGSRHIHMAKGRKVGTMLVLGFHEDVGVMAKPGGDLSSVFPVTGATG